MHFGALMSKIINQSQVSSKYTLPDSTSKTYQVMSNVSETEYMTDSFLKVRSSSKLYVIPSEEIEQTLMLTNNSEAEIENVVIRDTIGEGAKFKAGSLTINGQPYVNLEPNQFTLPTSIMPQNVVTVKYVIVIDDAPTVTKFATISNINYTVDEVDNLNENSNSVEINISNNVITIDKTSDKSAVVSGQILTFQNVITNKGALKNTEITFKDELPDGTNFMEGSVEIDGVSQPTFDPVAGFMIKDLNVGDEVTVSFKVKVD